MEQPKAQTHQTNRIQLSNSWLGTNISDVENVE